MSQQSYSFDLYRILMNDQPPYFLLEVLLRTLVIYGMTLLLLRWMGKRGMGQLSPFEFAIIVALGSAVGDPMFYDDVPLIPALLTILVIVALQRLLARLTEKHKVLEQFVESEPRLLVEAGNIHCQNLHEEVLSRDELLEALRQEGILHLGEVAVAYLEPSGKVSVIKGPPGRPGLSTLPEGKIISHTNKADGNLRRKCCRCCGQLTASAFSEDQKCSSCGESQWVLATYSLSDLS